ncbi:MAG: DUF3368 domain-containing protein [Proteobacteria bacterium]|nr:DUF3368 domain-containing protein [Pseudomonadota bacterium]
MIAVSNTSPLILLDKIHLLWILGKLFSRVVIPPAVDKEWLRPGGYSMPDWIAVEKLTFEARQLAKNLYKKIDKGEAEAMALFSSVKADVLLLDDLSGRRQAQAMKLPVIGTLGLLIAAKQKRIIPEITPALNTLKRNRFYISDEALQKALLLAKETK